MMAIKYMLNNPNVDIRGFSVDANGWSAQIDGVPNVLRLAKLYGLESVPVAYGLSDGYTELNLQNPSNLPNYDYLIGIGNYLNEWVPTPPSMQPASSLRAPDLILDLFKQAKEKGETVDILALGPLTNIAAAMHSDRELFLDILGAVYVSGANVFTQAEQAAQAASMPDVAFPYSEKTKEGSWNMFSDPIAAMQLQQSGANLVVLSSFGDKISIDVDDDQYIPEDCPPAEREHLTQFYTQYGPATNQTISRVKYWDAVTAVWMSQILDSPGYNPKNTSNSKNSTICTEWSGQVAQVDLNNGPTFSWFVQSPDFGMEFPLCNATDAVAFKSTYYSGICAGVANTADAQREQ
ncbi:hypothetical protein SARC_13739 [Sphaeroforma arctica JP610]|uniref:Inosine/uridine-preferring nucleoside hydrolase domain-containing protein n=1 Tax=Sphaeroforma arctica JP610 TaxID=667725 RepID=A0A0L0FB23_9EUKA|nr:hypothetical protein SARC_13739 [Sphaeroforma arctica JP610]KNC73701.1 hypothetical protein SARC_13739 [Sphaeroforma arctica JP610]|eukprot:XP_014147603.1 hypothetical protein SARC_13739 [Sphaeroforma arctica JP610]